MAAYTHYIAQNDTNPNLRATLHNADGTVYNLTGATSVRFVMGSLYGTIKVNTGATVIDAANGIVEYPWQAVDTATAGNYLAQFHITDAAGDIQTWPNGDYIAVSIEPVVA